MNLTRVFVLPAVLVLVCFTPGVLADGSLCFDALSYSVAQKPAGMAVGDFNDDGHPDLGVVNGRFGTEPGILSILIANGDGTFQPAADYPAGKFPIDVSVGDFNEDGNLDVAIAEYGYDYAGGSVAILLGNGDGTFQSRMEFSAGTNTYFILVGDFDSDAHLDVAVGNNNWPQGVTILQGTGDGSFWPIGHYYLVGGNPRGGVVGDFNGDGRLDLAVGVYQWPAGVEILLGNGNGTFQPPTHYDVPGNVSAVRGGDLNGDSRMDLVATSFESDTISILLGNGNGTFRLDASYAVGRTPVDVSVGDIDQDGRADVVVASADASFVSALLGNGDGTLGTMTPYPLADVAWHWGSIRTVDLDGDGRTDIAVTDARGFITVLLNGCAEFSVFDLKRIELDIGTLASADAYKLAGDFTQAAGRHVDLLRDELVVTLGPLKMTIPAGSFVAQGSGFMWTGKIGNATMTAAFVDLGSGVFGFGIEARAVDLGGVTNPVPIRLSIGRDWGEALLRVPGKLVLDQGMTVPGGLVPGTAVPVPRGR